MTINRRHFAATAALCVIPFAQSSRAASYPNHSIRMVVPYPPGGAADAFARAVAPVMSEALGQQVYIDNRPGGSSIIGATAVAHAAPDGYTFLLGDMSTYSTNRTIFKKISYDTFTDLTPITLTARFGLLLVVHPSVPVTTLQEFIALAKTRPGALSYGSPGIGSPHHLAMELLSKRAGIKLNHVPYKGDGPAMQDLLSGQIPVLISSLASANQHLKANKVRAIVSTGASRLQQAPQVPTISESGIKGFDTWAWQGFAAPTGTSPNIINTLNQAYAKAAADPRVRQRLVDLGGEVSSSTAEGMHQLMRSEAEAWGAVIREAGINLE